MQRICKMSSRLAEALLAADVLCGLNRNVSIPGSVRTNLTQRLMVSLLTLLKGRQYFAFEIIISYKIKIPLQQEL